MQTKRSFCRVCQAFCAIEVDVENGRVVEVRGDRTDPMSRGYTCAKGRQLPHEVNDPDRLRSSLVRTAAGAIRAHIERTGDGRDCAHGSRTSSAGTARGRWRATAGRPRTSTPPRCRWSKRGTAASARR